MLSKYKRRELEKEKSQLEQRCEIKSAQVAAIRKKLIIETDASIQFKYDKEIEEGERILESINSSLNEVDKKIQDDDRSREIKASQERIGENRDRNISYLSWKRLRLLLLFLLLLSTLGANIQHFCFRWCGLVAIFASQEAEHFRSLS
jgi:hypothetical protein